MTKSPTLHLQISRIFHDHQIPMNMMLHLWLLFKKGDFPQEFHRKSSQKNLRSFLRKSAKVSCRAGRRRSWPWRGTPPSRISSNGGNSAGGTWWAARGACGEDGEWWFNGDLANFNGISMWMIPIFHLVGGLGHGIYVSIQLGISSSQLTNWYFSEVGFNHQPGCVVLERTTSLFSRKLWILWWGSGESSHIESGVFQIGGSLWFTLIGPMGCNQGMQWGDLFMEISML